MALKLITAATIYPVSTDEAKSHLRVTDDDDEALIDALVGAATKHAEKYLGRALIDQTWELTLDEFPTDEDNLAIQIPLPPLIEVVSVKYDDGAGDEQTLDADQYTVDDVSQPGWIVPASSWPSTFDGINAVRVRFRAGYVDRSVSPADGEVPEDIIAAIKLIVGTLYAHRETVIVGQTVTEMPWAAKALLNFHRVELSMA